MKKKLAVFLAMLMFIASMVACQTTQPESESNTQTETSADESNPNTQVEDSTDESTATPVEVGEKIRVMFANHNWTNAVKPRLSEFTELTGIEIVEESYPEDQLSQKLAIELTSGSSGLDVFMSRPLQEIKMFIKNGWVYDISPLMQDSEVDSDDFIPSTMESYMDESHCYGFPLVTERQILYYRKDLFAEKGLSVPTNMEELMACAEALNDPDAGVYGIVSRGLSAAAITQFSGYLYGCGGDWMTDGKASVNTPEAVEALTYYGDMLRNYGPPGVLNMHWQQAAGVFAQGQAAMYTDADSLFNSAVDKSQSAIADQVGFAVMPTGKAYNITSWGLSVNANTAKPEAAMKFVKWAASADIMKDVQTQGVPGSRNSVWDDPEANEGFPEELVEVIQASSNIGVAYDRPLVIQVGKARDSIGLAIVAAIEGKDVQAAADKANEEFQAIIEEDFGS